jgi:hypothetical protein
VIALLAILLTVLFSSPDDRPSTIAQWSRQLPVNFVTSATEQLDGTSGTATYGPPYNHNGEGQHAAVLYPQKWLGVSHPINAANDFVIDPLKTVPDNPTLQSSIPHTRPLPQRPRRAGPKPTPRRLKRHRRARRIRRRWPGRIRPVPVMMAPARPERRLDGALLTSRQFYQTDYTSRCCSWPMGTKLANAHEQHLEGDQWGMMNETEATPGRSGYGCTPSGIRSNCYRLRKRGHPRDVGDDCSQPGVHLHPVDPGIRSLPRHILIYRLI